MSNNNLYVQAFYNGGMTGFEIIPKVIGDLKDDEISLYNRLKPYVDGDLGIAYTDKHLYIGSA